MEQKYTPKELDEILSLAVEMELNQTSTKSEMMHTEQDIIDSATAARIPEELVKIAIAKYNQTNAPAVAEYHDQSKRKPNYFWNKIRSISSTAEKKIAAGLLALAVLPISYNFVIEPWWNSSQYALERLSQYTTFYPPLSPVKKQQIISDLDEIIEEHTFDDYSDHNAERYFSLIIRESGENFSDAAKVLDIVGKYSTDRIDDVPNHWLAESSYTYLEFLKANNASLSAGETWLRAAKLVHGDLPPDVLVRYAKDIAWENLLRPVAKVE